MKNEIEKLNKKYNININIEKNRYDVYDAKGGYYFKFWVIINNQAICVIKTRANSLEEKIKELEAKIKSALNSKGE